MKSLQELAAIRDKMRQTVSTREAAHDAVRVVVGMATCGIAAGARPVGICQYEPVVEVYMPGQAKTTYVKMTPDKVKRVVQQHLKGGNPVAEYTIGAAR